MGTYAKFEDLPVWQAATDLGVRVFTLTEHESFRYKGDLVNQLRRAVLSVGNNIAEGFERGTTAELITFLYYARGSAGEVRSMLRFALALGKMLVCEPELQALVDAAVTISRQIRAWADSLQNSDIRGQRHLTSGSRAAYQQEKSKAEYLDYLRSAQETRVAEMIAKRQQAQGPPVVV